MLNVTVQGDKEVVQRFAAMPPAVRAVVAAKLRDQGINLVTYIQTQKLSGQVLNARTSSLRASITAEGPTEEGTALYERVFSAGDVKYARFWEYGFHGEETVKAHERLTKDADNPKGFKTVNSIGSFTRHVDQAARPFMRPALAENAAQIAAGLKAAVLKGVRDALGKS